MKRWILFLALAMPTGAFSAESSEVAEKLKAAMAHERRTDAERARDANRKPIETLEFMRLRDNMKVLELIPGGGWYTKLLGPVLADRGKLYVAIGAERLAEMIETDEGFASTNIVPFPRESLIRKPGERRFSVPEFSFDLRGIDLVLTFRNMHNLDDAGRHNLNKAVYRALRKGGYYGVVDHTRRHMQPYGEEVWRRIDPVKVIKEVEAAGFEFVDYSDLHYKPDDQLLYEVGRASVRGNTDRFTLLFRKR